MMTRQCTPAGGAQGRGGGRGVNTVEARTKENKGLSAVEMGE